MPLRASSDISGLLYFSFWIRVSINSQGLLELVILLWLLYQRSQTCATRPCFHLFLPSSGVWSFYCLVLCLFWFFIILYVYIHKYNVYIHDTHIHVHKLLCHGYVDRGQRTTFGNGFSPFTVTSWDQTQCFSPWAIGQPVPVFCFSYTHCTAEKWIMLIKKGNLHFQLPNE